MSEELDGMAALRADVSRQEWPLTMDARVWVEKFAEHHPEIDKDLMRGWFAHAIMAGYDTAMMHASRDLHQLIEASKITEMNHPDRSG